jgi:hypothetical protein
MSYPDFGDCKDLRGRSPVDPAIFKEPRTLILLVAGQSMWSNSSNAAPYVPWTGGVFEFNIADGQCYPSDGGPVLGANIFLPGRISITPYLADLIVANNKASRVLMVNVCVNGTTAQDWSPVGQCYPRIPYVLNQLETLGISPNYCCFLQGQADVANGDTHDNYVNLRVWCFNAMRGAGYSGPIVNGLGVHWTNVSDVNPTEAAAIKQGQFDAAVTAGISAGPDDDEFGDAYRVDGVHWNDGGRYYTTQRWLPAIPVF